MRSKTSMRITEYGRQSVKTEDFALVLGELVATGINNGTPDEELAGHLRAYTAIRMCMRPDNTVSVSPEGIVKILAERWEEISKVIESALKLGSEKKLHTRLVTPIENKKLSQ